MQLLEYNIIEARKSLSSALPRVFAYVDYRLIGIHELPRSANTSLVYDSLLRQGYRGPAISVFYAHNDPDLSSIVSGGTLDVAYGVVGVADGHNRLEALRLLDVQGRLCSPYIPVQLIPAHDPGFISRISIDDASEEPVPLSIVEDCFADPQKVILVTNSCFAAKLVDGSWVRVRDAQPDMVIPKYSLLRAPVSARDTSGIGLQSV